MARLPEKERKEREALILADWKAGYSQNHLAKKYDVSSATINKVCKGVPQENAEIVNSQTAINTALASKSEQEVNAIHNAVDDRTRHLMYFQNSALRNQALADGALDAIESMSNSAKTDKEKQGIALAAVSTLKDHSAITAKNKETVLGKETSTTNVAVQTNVGVQSFSEMYGDSKSKPN